MAQPKSKVTIRRPLERYEQRALLYFDSDGMQMVSIVRERSYFDSALKNDVSLEAYLAAGVNEKSYVTAKAIEELIPNVE